MPVHNADIAAVFEEIADLLEIDNANPFRIRAYRNAAREMQALGRDARELVEQGEDLSELPGIGKELAAKIAEIVHTGHCQALEKLRKQTAPGLPELLKIPGLGPKRVRAVYHDMDIHSAEQLLRAAHDHRLRELPGFGPKTEAHILEVLHAHVEQEQIR
jgi:DNA polymerase (family 10)